LSYSSPTVTATVGTAISDDTPSWSTSSGTPSSFAVAPNLPAGLALSQTTGVLSGTPTAVTLAGNYTVTASNSAGSTSATINVKVGPQPLTITSQPANTSVTAGSTATFTVAASGTGTLSYQWHKNGGLISGATSSSYTTPATTSTDSGATFDVAVKDAYGDGMISTSATLTVTGGCPHKSFCSTGPLGTARAFHTATLLQNGKVLIVGGEASSPGLAIAQGELYDPATGTFTNTGSLHIARFYHTATLLPDGRVLIAGGNDGPDTYNIENTGEVYDPATGAFTLLTSTMTVEREVHTATLLPTGQVLLTGGENNGLVGNQSTDLFFPTTNIFSGCVAMTAPRWSHTASLVSVGGDAGVLLSGGRNEHDFSMIAAELIAPPCVSSTAVGNMTAQRVAQTAAVIPDGGVFPGGDVLVIGGYDSLDNAESSTDHFSTTTLSFDAGPAMQFAQALQTQATLSNGLVLLIGGLDTSGNPLATTQYYDSTQDAFFTTGSMTTPRLGSTATLLPNGQLLVVGGFPQTASNTPATHTAELYNP
jgi:hypothetical protein